MKTGHVNVGFAGDATDFSFAQHDNFTQPGAFRELLVLQAIDLAAQTTDTSFFILGNGVITLHGILPGMPFA